MPVISQIVFIMLKQNQVKQLYEDLYSLAAVASKLIARRESEAVAKRLIAEREGAPRPPRVEDVTVEKAIEFAALHEERQAERLKERELAMQRDTLERRSCSLLS